MGIFKKQLKLPQDDINITREDLLRRSRILIIDDEKPDLIEDLKGSHFSVDHVPDITKENLSLIESPIYDLIILDFGNVGGAFGQDQGLSLLRHIKRVNPSVVVFAYTSKALFTEHADFFRVADAVLPKDAGITESMERIEEGLRKANSIQNLWSGLLKITHVTPDSKTDREWQDLFIRGQSNPGKKKQLWEKVTNTLGGEAGQKVGLLIFEKIIEIGAKYYFGK